MNTNNLYLTIMFVTLIGNNISRTIVNDFFEFLGIKGFNSFYCNQQDALNGLTTSMLYNESQLTSYRYLKNGFKESFQVINRRPTFIDLSCSQGRNLFSNSSKLNYLRSFQAWLLWTPSLEDANFLLSKSWLGVDSRVLLVVGSNLNIDSEHRFFSVLKYHPRSEELVVRELDSFRDLMNPEKTDFNGHRLNAIMVFTELNIEASTLPGITVDDTYQPELDVSNRMSISLYLLFQELYNFTCVYSVAKGWGYLQSNGSFSDMLGMMETGKYDIGVSVSAYATDRLAVVQFLPVVTHWDIHFLFRQMPSFGGPKALSRPFHSTIWIAVALMLFVTACMFAIGSRLVVRSEEQINHEDSYYTREERYSWSSALLLLFGIMGQQGIDEESQKTSLRVLSLLSIVFSFLVYSHYGSEILNGLLSKSPSTIRNFQDLIDSNLRLALWDVPYVRTDFNNTDPMSRSLVMKGQKQPGGLQLVNLARGVELIQTGRYAFLTSPLAVYSQIFEKFSNSEICTLYSLTKPDFLKIASPVLTRISSFREISFTGYTKLKETGLEKRELIRWLPPRPPCLPEQEFNSVAPESLIIAYIILIIGLFLSTIILLTEILYNGNCRYGAIKCLKRLNQ